MKITNEEITKLVKEQLPKRDVLTILLSGSRLNHIEKNNSDYDLVVIVSDKKEELLTHELFSKRIYFGDINGIAVDGKVMSQNKFLEEMLKLSVDIFELFYQEPIYNISEETLFWYLKQSKKLILQSGFSTMVNSSKKLINIRSRAIIKGLYNKDRLLTSIKETWYIYQLLILDNPDDLDISCSTNKIGYLKSNNILICDIIDEFWKSERFLNRLIVHENSEEAKRQLIEESFDIIIKHVKNQV